MLTLEGLAKRFGSRELWSGVSFAVHPGQLVALAGPSGCGKTTLLNCMGMLEAPSAGTIILNGTAIAGLRGARRRRIWRSEMGFLFQDCALVESARVGSNVSVVRPHLRVGAGMKAARDEALASVGLGGRADEPTFHLSGGEQQRVALARIILKSPALILADEPTGSLDADNEEMVLHHLRDLADQGRMVVIATHSERVLSACDARVDLG